jgi:hypothetical protein
MTKEQSIFMQGVNYVHGHVHYLNNSKYFAGIIMILLNLGSKFISVQFSKSAEQYLKWSISRQILIFSMAWLATREIYVALTLTAVFVILSDHLFNEESDYCIIPHHHRVLHKLEKEKDSVSDEELTKAIAILEKSKKEKQTQKQKEIFARFYNYSMVDDIK